jgi:hypothetical protein
VPLARPDDYNRNGLGLGVQLGRATASRRLASAALTRTPRGADPHAVNGESRRGGFSSHRLDTDLTRTVVMPVAVADR